MALGDKVFSFRIIIVQPKTIHKWLIVQTSWSIIQRLLIWNFYWRIQENAERL